MIHDDNLTKHVSQSTPYIDAARECERVPAQREPSRCTGGNSLGAPPSNTAPANYISDPKDILQVLRFGVDSLYLSYPGTLATGWDQRLKGLKLAAKANDRKDESTAQIKIWCSPL